MKVIIGDKNIIYETIDINKNTNEVCVLQTFEYSSGISRQIKIWTSDYREVVEKEGRPGIFHYEQSTKG
ncbi:MAG TPA: hypothetical protein VMZ91_03965 [Candidatus Paceibacterota bacterium]|nr:hypothetical protein [Candidatus Paceibacterota bacterium]